jgi:hypothetical protein
MEIIIIAFIGMVAITATIVWRAGEREARERFERRMTFDSILREDFERVNQEWERRWGNEDE